MTTFSEFFDFHLGSCTFLYEENNPIFEIKKENNGWVDSKVEYPEGTTLLFVGDKDELLFVPHRLKPNLSTSQRIKAFIWLQNIQNATNINSL